MSEKTNIPQIRFKGFNDVWEQCKLNDLGVSTSGTSIESEFSDEGVYNVISIGSYSEDSIYNDQGIKAIHSSKTENRVLDEGDLTMILNDKTQAGRILGRVLLIEKSSKYVYNQRTQRIQPYKNKFSSEFLYHLLNAPLVRNKIIKQSQGNTQIYVNWSAIKETEYFVPNLVEQEKLGQMFSKINDLITLHQRKHEKYTNIKKALLEKIFPQNGEKIPQIRFKGFTEAWEQCKLNDLGVSTSGTSIESEFSDEGVYNVISIGSYSEDSIYNDQGIKAIHSSKTENRVLDEGDLTMILNDKTQAGRILGRVLLIEKSSKYVYNQRTQRIQPYKNKFSSEFLYHLLNAPLVRNKIIKQSQGNTQIYVNWSAIKETEYFVPNLVEQEKLGQMFSKINDLITLHQRECEKLKNIKKSLLEKMFV